MKGETEPDEITMMIFAHIRDNFAAAFFPRLGEWACAGMLAGIGWILLINGTLMQGARSPAYDGLLAWAPQSTWAIIMLVVGGLRLAVLLVNGAWRRSPHYRTAAAFLSLFFWVQIAQSMSEVFGIAFGFALGVAGLDFANMIRAAGDARIVDHAFQRGMAAGGGRK